MIDAKLRKLFFDGQTVIRAIDKARRTVLATAGAYVRNDARQSIRKRKGPSKPGSAPSSHAGTLKNLIFFTFDPNTKSVVIGPAIGGPRTGAPNRLEFELDRPFMGPAFAKNEKKIDDLWAGSVRK